MFVRQDDVVFWCGSASGVEEIKGCFECHKLWSQRGNQVKCCLIYLRGSCRSRRWSGVSLHICTTLSSHVWPTLGQTNRKFMRLTVHSCCVQPSNKQNVSEEFCKYFKTQNIHTKTRLLSLAPSRQIANEREGARAVTTSMWSEKFFASPDKRKICRQLVVVLLFFSLFRLQKHSAREHIFSIF